MFKKEISQEQLLNFLTKRSVSSIVTFSSGKKFDISSDNVIGYEKFHEAIFLLEIEKYMNNKVDIKTIILREFTKNICYVIKEVKIPFKKIYGFIFDSGKIFVIDKDFLKSSYDENDKSELYLEAF